MRKYNDTKGISLHNIKTECRHAMAALSSNISGLDSFVPLKTDTAAWSSVRYPFFCEHQKKGGEFANISVTVEHLRNGNHGLSGIGLIMSDMWVALNRQEKAESEKDDLEQQNLLLEKKVLLATFFFRSHRFFFYVKFCTLCR